MNPLLTVRRQRRWLAHVALLVFVASLWTAWLSPLVRPGNWQLVCSASGAQWVNVDADPADPASPAPQAHGLDCVFCLPLAGTAPPAQVLPAVQLAPVSPVAPAPVHATWRLRERVPARDPPLFMA